MKKFLIYKSVTILKATVEADSKADALVKARDDDSVKWGWEKDREPYYEVKSLNK